MPHGEIYSVLLEGLRALFLIVVPLTVAITVAGALAGAAQASTSIVDVAIGYAARLLATAVILYLFFPVFSRSVIALAQQAFQ